MLADSKTFCIRPQLGTIMAPDKDLLRTQPHSLKHVKAWLKPHLQKVRKTVTSLPGFGIIFAKLAA